MYDRWTAWVRRYPIGSAVLVAAAVAVIALLTTRLPGEGVRGGPLARAFGIGLAVLIGLLVVAAFARRNGR